MNWLYNAFRSVRDTPYKLRNAKWSDVQPKLVTGLKVANVACAWHVFTQHVGWFYRVEGPSMLPTMDVEREWIVESRMWSFPTLQRGDLVTFTSPLDPTRLVCKRLIGLPGDIVCVDPTGRYAPSTEHVVVPKGHIWVSGDNMLLSRDSREHGPVPAGLIRGKFIGRAWPLRKATVFQRNFHYID